MFVLFQEQVNRILSTKSTCLAFSIKKVILKYSAVYTSMQVYKERILPLVGGIA